MASPAQYHELQFAICADPADARYTAVEFPANCEAWLDVGCGAGAFLERRRSSANRAVGVDFDVSALQLGKNLGVAAPLAGSTGERLPFRDASFDFLTSRVAVPYMNIPVAVREFARVLRPGGHMWLVLHPLSRLNWRQTLKHPKHFAYEAYKLLNTAALHWGLPQFRCPHWRRRWESYQTDAGMLRTLREAAFEDIRIERGPHYVVTARKPV